MLHLPHCLVNLSLGVGVVHGGDNCVGHVLGGDRSLDGVMALSPQRNLVTKSSAAPRVVISDDRERVIKRNLFPSAEFSFLSYRVNQSLTPTISDDLMMVASGNSSRTAMSPRHLDLRYSEPLPTRT